MALKMFHIIKSSVPAITEGRKEILINLALKGKWCGECELITYEELNWSWPNHVDIGLDAYSLIDQGSLTDNLLPSLADPSATDPSPLTTDPASGS